MTSTTKTRKAVGISLILVALLFAGVRANAQSLEKGEAFCYGVQDYANALVTYTQTKCIPAGGSKPKSLSLILISSEPVFSVEASKKAWLLVLVGAVGKKLNDDSSAHLDELWFSDIDRMKERIGYVLPADLAKTLQRRIKADQIDLDQMYAEIQKKLTRREVPESHATSKDGAKKR